MKHTRQMVIVLAWIVLIAGGLVVASSLQDSQSGFRNITRTTDVTADISGTADQVIVTDNGDKTITLSTPQDIATTSTVVFGGITAQETSPEYILYNTTEEDSDSGRESSLRWKGEQSGGELTTLAMMRGSHDGTADDEKGKLVFLVNDGNDGDSPTSQMKIDSVRVTLESGILSGAEATTPSAVADYWDLYSKTDNKLYFQSGDGAEHLVHPVPVVKSYSFVSRASVTGEAFLAGFYNYSTTDANLNQGALTATHGGNNHPYAAHAFIVSGGNGTTDGSDLVLTVSGTSITDAGVRSTGDSEVIEATAGASALNSYYETVKKWLGTITFTLSSAGGGTFNYDFCYGFAKYEDFGNRDFTLTDFEFVGLPDANDASFDIEVLYHSSAGWIYAASGFIAGAPALYKMTVVHGTESDIDSGEGFAFKRTGLSDSFTGNNGEGIIIRLTTGAAKALAFMNAHIGVEVID